MTGILVCWSVVVYAAVISFVLGEKPLINDVAYSTLAFTQLRLRGLLGFLNSGGGDGPGYEGCNNAH